MDVTATLFDGIRQCHGSTRQGERCKMVPPHGAAYCFQHDPALRAEARRLATSRKCQDSMLAKKGDFRPMDHGQAKALLRRLVRRWPKDLDLGEQLRRALEECGP